MIIKIDGSVSELQELSRVFSVIDKTECITSSMEVVTLDPQKLDLSEKSSMEIRQIVKDELENVVFETSAPEKEEKVPVAGKDARVPKKKKKKSSPADDVTVEDIKRDVDVSSFPTVQGLICEILAVCGIGGSALGRLMELTPSEISLAKKGKDYPYIRQKFKQYFGFVENSE